jgi:hypothetical protein
VVYYARFHGGRNPQCLVNPAEIVVHVVKRNGLLERLGMRSL